MRAPSQNPEVTGSPVRLLVVVALVVMGAVFGTLGYRTESTLLLTWFGAAVLAWVVAAVPPGPLPWRPRRGWSAQVVVAPLVLGLVLGALAVAGLALGLTAGLGDAVQQVFAPWRRVDWWWSLLGVVALAMAEELALRHGLFALLPRPARILGTMAVSAVVWWVIGNEVTALGAVVVGLACARQRWVTASVLGPVITHVTSALVVAGGVFLFWW